MGGAGDGLTPGQLWAVQALREAEEGLLTCRKCRCTGPVESAITVWRNGAIVYGLCDRCLADNDFLITRTDKGIEIRGHSRSPIEVS